MTKYQMIPDANDPHRPPCRDCDDEPTSLFYCAACFALHCPTIQNFDADLFIDTANQIDQIIPDDADCRSDADSDESLCNDLAAHYLTHYANRPLTLDLLETCYIDLAR